MKNIDFSQGSVRKCIIMQAVPLTVAQLVHILYNLVDRIYIGHLGDGDSIALTGVGLTFPVITLIMAFTALFGNGGLPLFSMAHGAGDKEKAQKILGNSAFLLISSSVILTVLGYILTKPLLFAFGASGESFVYAKEYLNIYLTGTLFAMISTGLNGYINSQGFPRIGMFTVVIGAAVNIVLDPIFIFVFDMGVGGAALATVISQAVSALWIIAFLTGKKAVVPLKISNIRAELATTKNILRVGTANFIMQGTNFLVQASCNSTLQIYGGDIFVGIMTVINSIREIFTLPLTGIVNGAQPVISFNYGAKKYDRVSSAISFNTKSGVIYTLAAWLLIVLFPSFWFGVFSDDAVMALHGAQMLKIYFFGFIFMALQFAGQSVFQALGDAKHAIIFSLLRKVVIVVPLTLLLPRIGFGVAGVFLAEPISNVIGGLCCYITMKITVGKALGNRS
ncbi:MAG: MATE family efflux transporter [Ruminococcaceae bacterium]|nr:MATE family efflux transporter [Oscillospiraceae bacterium]